MENLSLDASSFRFLTSENFPPNKLKTADIFEGIGQGFTLCKNKETGAMSLKTDSYIVPYAITGDYKFRSKNLTVRIGKPFKATSDLKESNDKLKNQLKETYEKMNNNSKQIFEGEFDKDS